MSNADNKIKEILATYDEDFAANTWVVPGGKARAIKHDCIERMVGKAKINFGEPQIVDPRPDNVVIIVTGVMDGQSPVWSFGEASPKNNKNAYPYAMAEKRAKDRVALKLIGLHGLLYSEEEADDFKAPQQSSPVEVKQDDFDLPPVDDTSNRTLANALIETLKRSQTEAELDAWVKDAKNKSAVKSLPDDLRAEVIHAGSVHRSALQFQASRAA